MATQVPAITIIDVETNERVQALAWNPFTNQSPANYVRDPIRGRSTPQVGYVNTDEDMWSVSLFLSTAARILDADADSRTVQDTVAFLKSFNYPDYGAVEGSTAAVKPPHRIMVVRGEFRVVGYMSGYSYQEMRPYDLTGLPMVVEVSFSVHSLPPSPRGLRDVREWWRS